LPEELKGENPEVKRMTQDKLAFIREDMDQLRETGLFNNIRTMDSPADAWMVVDGRRVLNLCTNNYLGLANHPDIVLAAQEGLKGWGYGLSSVRFICGTQDVQRVAICQNVSGGRDWQRPPVHCHRGALGGAAFSRGAFHNAF
jgi:hypothetical protein